MIDPADRELELALGDLKPASPTITAMSVLEKSLQMAEQARRIARLQTWIWRAGTAIAATLALVAWLRTTPMPTERVVIKVVHEDRASAASAHDSRRDVSQEARAYLILRQQVLKDGLAALPDEPVISAFSAPLPGEDESH